MGYNLDGNIIFENSLSTLENKFRKGYTYGFHKELFIAIHFVLDWVMLCEEFHGLLIFKSSLMQFHTSLPCNFIHLHKP